MSGMNRSNIARLSMSGLRVGWSGHLRTPLKKIHTKNVHKAVRNKTGINGPRNENNSESLGIAGATQYAMSMIAAGTMPIASILSSRTSFIQITNQGDDIIITK